MFSCAFCGKAYETPAERFACEARCQGIAISDTQQGDITAINAVSKLRQEGANENKASEDLMRQRNAAQKKIIETLATLFSQLKGYETRYNENITLEVDNCRAKCEFRGKDITDVLSYDADEGTITSTETFSSKVRSRINASQSPSMSDDNTCDGDCSCCSQNKGERAEDTCNGDCSHCSQSRCEQTDCKCERAEGTIPVSSRTPFADSLIADSIYMTRAMLRLMQLF